MKRALYVALGFGVQLIISTVPAASPPPASPVQIDAMTGEQLMDATAKFDAQLASDLARLSNIEAMSTVCGWKENDFSAKRLARLGLIKDSGNKRIAERFYADILAKDVKSYRKDKPAELCVPENKESAANIFAEW